MSSIVAIILGSLFVSAVLGANSTNSTNGTALRLDPVTNFCKRLYHQSAVKNGYLYIDGGLEVFVPENNDGAAVGNMTLGYNTFLLKVDMTSSWDWKQNISIVELNKTANPLTGTSPPLVVQAALFSGSDSDQNIYLYGGTVSWVNVGFPGWQFPNPPTYSLWSYNTATSGWNQYDITLDTPNRPYAGAYAEAPDLNLALWLDGALNNGSSNTNTGSVFHQALGGLVLIDMNNQTAMNLSTASLGDRFPRENGGLTYISGPGQKGIAVAIGGTTRSVTDTEASSIGTFVSLDTVDVFDVASLYSGTLDGAWYSQQATGDIPAPRMDFCLVTATAPDNSSYNIYLYGGRNATVDFDDIYVLSLPSFTWIKIYEGQSSRWGHTCHLVGNSQMLTVGGAHGISLYNGCDWELKSVAIYSMSSLTWGSVYDAAGPSYTVPNLVYQVIGGSAQGGATLNSPASGYSSSGIAQLFGPAPDNNSASGGTIAGAIIGSVAGAALVIGGLVFFLIRRRRAKALEQKRQAQRHRELEATEKKVDPPTQEDEMHELSSNQQHTELPPSQLHEVPADSLHELDSNKRTSKYKQVSELEAHQEL